METLFSTQYLRIFLHSTTPKTLELQWLNFVPSANFRASLEELMRLARQHRALALIADNCLLRALRPVDLAWSGALVLKGFSELGRHRFAAVESLDAMNRMGVSSLVATVIPNTNPTSQFFTTTKEARAWATAPSDTHATYLALFKSIPARCAIFDLQWLSYMDSASFRAAATQAFTFARTYHVAAWLGDDELVGAVHPRGLAWVVQAILPPLPGLA